MDLDPPEFRRLCPYWLADLGPLLWIWTPLLKSLGVTKLHPAIFYCCLNLDNSAGIPRPTQMAARSAEISVHSSLYSGKPPREVQKWAFLDLLKTPQEVQSNVRGFVIKVVGRRNDLFRGGRNLLADIDRGPNPLWHRQNTLWREHCWFILRYAQNPEGWGIFWKSLSGGCAAGTDLLGL